MPSLSCVSVRLCLVSATGLGLATLSGCHKTVMVYGPSALPNALTAPATTDDTAKEKAANKQLPGIPFYGHRGVCTQETVWLEPQTTITLTVTPEAGKSTTQTMTLNNRAFHDTTANLNPDLSAPNLVAHLKALQGDHDPITGPDSPYCPAVAAANWQKVEARYPVTPIPETPAGIQAAIDAVNLVVITNTADIGSAVDYTRVYYLNAKTPVNGTSSVDAKLNADGTLGEGSVSRDDETLSTVLTTLGTVASGGLTAWSTVKSATITGNATVAAAAAAPQVAGNQAHVQPYCGPDGGWPAVPTGKKVTFDLSIETKGFTHDHKQVVPLESLANSCVADSFVTGGSFTITPVSGGDKADKNAITVSGTVTLPKAKDDKK
jgi:hypothetical protein